MKGRTKEKFQRSLQRRLFDVLMLHQLKSRFVGKAYDTNLSLLEALLIAELEVQPNIGAQELVLLLKVDKSTVSRMLAKLEKGNYLKISAHPKDKRKRVLELAEEGRHFLRQRDKSTAQTLSYFLQNIPAAEQSELQRFLKLLADGDGGPELCFRPNEHPILIEMRRISRSFDIYGDSFLGSGEDNFTFQVLREISLNANKVKIGDLAQLFGMPLNSMSQILSRYEERGLLKRDSSERDARIRVLYLTETGLKLLEHIEACAEKRLVRALNSLSPAQLGRFVDLLGRYVGGGVGREDGSVILADALTVRKISDAQELQQCRAFYITQLVRAGRQLEIVNSLLDPSHSIFCLYEGKNAAAILEVNTEGDTLHILNFASELKIENSEMEQIFLRTAARALGAETKKLSFQAPTGSWAADVLKRLGAKVGKSNNVRLSF